MNCTRCDCSLEGRSVYTLDSGEPGKFCMECAPLNASPREICFKPVAINSQTEKSVKEILQHMLERADEFTGVVVVANCKNGEQYLRSSKQNCKEKSYLLAFFQAWVMGIFKIHYDEGETSLDGK